MNKIQLLVGYAQRTAGYVLVLAVITLLAGGGLWGLLFQGLLRDPNLWLLPALLVLGVLLAPGLVLFTYHLALREVLALPADVKKALAARSETAQLALKAGASVKTFRANPLRTLRLAWDLRKVLGQGKDLLLQYALLVRVFHPLYMLAVVVSLVIGIGLFWAFLIGLVVMGVGQLI